MNANNNSDGLDRLIVLGQPTACSSCANRSRSTISSESIDVAELLAHAVVGNHLASNLGRTGQIVAGPGGHILKLNLLHCATGKRLAVALATRWKSTSGSSFTLTECKARICSREPEEWHARLPGYRTGEEGLAGSRRARLFPMERRSDPMAPVSRAAQTRPDRRG